MVSKRIMAFYAFVDLWLLAAGLLSLIMSIVWRTPNLMLSFTISNSDLTAGLVLGIMLLVTFLISIFAVAQRGHVTAGLVFLNWTLIADAIAIGVIGSFIWFYSLHQRNNYYVVFKAQSESTRQAIQDKFSCCGYFMPNDTTAIGGFCANQTFVDSLFNATATDTHACVGPITGFTDFTLNNIFTTIYGYMAIVIALFLASLCVIHQRNETERFKKIDAKRGGKGFV
ncbi:tetraspanin [Phanerochaete sordida]|uniref:Tetraspanin n=1 Tax=Phanerochaete sordida TaxID=48140 RepID=A0A9P3G0M1_9APHY|nr:tetraspanin [Phanerochaete sordida]